MGSTPVRLGYEDNLSKLLSGARGEMFSSVLAESGLSGDDGELFVDVPADSLPRGLFSLGQGLTRIEGVGLWTRSRVESTFHDDLRRILLGCVAADEVQESFVVPGRPEAEIYSIDCCIEAPRRPLFLFGVQHTSKARQTIILLQHPQAHEVAFEFMVVCSDIEELPKADRARLMIAANDVTPNIHNTAAIEQKIRHRRVV